jgi:hypothetical protein
VIDRLEAKLIQMGHMIADRHLKYQKLILIEMLEGNLQQNQTIA